MRRPRETRRRGRRALLSCLLALALAGCGGGCAGGFIFGDPTGLSVSWPLGGRKNVVLGLGMGLAGGESGGGHVDWIQHASRVRGGEWVPYWGLGVGFHVVDRGGSVEVARAGPRVPLGLTYDFGRMRPYLFAELAPGFDAIDEKATLGWGLGLRFAF